MPNSTFASTPSLGVNFDRKTTTPEVRVGTVVQLISSHPSLQGKLAMYVKANGVIGNSSYATVALASISCLASSVAAATSSGLFRNGSVAFADGEYGWLACVSTAIPRGDYPQAYGS